MKRQLKAIAPLLATFCIGWVGHAWSGGTPLWGALPTLEQNMREGPAGPGFRPNAMRRLEETDGSGRERGRPPHRYGEGNRPTDPNEEGNPRAAERGENNGENLRQDDGESRRGSDGAPPSMGNIRGNDSGRARRREAGFQGRGATEGEGRGARMRARRWGAEREATDPEDTRGLETEKFHEQAGSPDEPTAPKMDQIPKQLAP